MNLKRIHILCLKPEICSLIKKALPASVYYSTCTNEVDINDQFIDNFNEPVDCLILDKDIDIRMREKIKEKFKNISIICLPSLESEYTYKSGVKNLSEPFKLSELSEYINSIFKKD